MKKRPGSRKKNTRRPKFPSPAQSSQKREEITQMLMKEKMEERFQGLFFMICSCLARVKRRYKECDYPASMMVKTRQKKNTYLPFYFSIHLQMQRHMCVRNRRGKEQDRIMEILLSSSGRSYHPSHRCRGRCCCRSSC
jgi:hypothetical protein